MIEGRGFGGWGAIEIAANGRTGAATPTAVGVHASAQAVAAWWGD